MVRITRIGYVDDQISLGFCGEKSLTSSSENSLGMRRVDYKNIRMDVSMTKNQLDKIGSDDKNCSRC